MKVMKKEYIVIIIIFVVIVGFLSYSRTVQKNVENSATNTTASVEIGGTVFTVDVVDTEIERAQGLSLRESLATNEGMLFIFEKPGMYSFWMKDMSFPIDIIWIDENLKVVYIKENAMPQSFPEIFTPSVSAMYTLEVIASTTEKKKIKIGDDVNLNISNVQ